MIEVVHADLSILAQCRLLSISRSSFYYAPQPESDETLALMRVGNRGKREFIQVLRLLEALPLDIVTGAVTQAIEIGAVGFDAIKLIALARIERRPARLDLAAYPHLPRTAVKTTSAADYAVLAA